MANGRGRRKKGLSEQWIKRAKLVRFYGFGHEEVKNMPAVDIEKYWRAITVIESREALLSMKITATPHMKQNDREKIKTEFTKDGFPNDKNYMTASSLATRLSKG